MMTHEQYDFTREIILRSEGRVPAIIDNIQVNSNVSKLLSFEMLDLEWIGKKEKVLCTKLWDISPTYSIQENSHFLTLL